MRRRSWAVVTASAALTAVVCGFLTVQGPSGTSTASAGSTSSPGAEAAAASGTATKAAASVGDESSSGTSSRRPSGAQTVDSGSGSIDTGLSKPTQGKAALAQLGDKVAVVAHGAGLTEAQLRGVLESDETAWVTPAGRVAYHEEIPTAPTPSTGFTANPLTAPYPLADTFTLHSLPGSTHTLYLDFDGVTVSAGNAWHSEADVPVGAYVGWDPSGDGPTFSADERAAIQEIWARVAEDYAAFDIDVTTQAPSQAALTMNSASDTSFGTHLVFTDAAAPAQAICGGQCGGVAWTGVINSPITLWAQHPSNDINEIAWVFPDAMAQLTSSMAEAASHEAGHTFGLVHDGDDAAGDSYYSPGWCAQSQAGDPGCTGLNIWGTDRVWAPIMGASYYNAVTQWSKGDYPGAHNWGGTSSGPAEIARQDDVAIIRSAVGTRETVDSSVGSPLTVDPDGTQYITRSSQADTYALGTCDLGATVTATVGEVGPNLDLALSVVDSTGIAVTGTTPNTNPGTTQAEVRSLEPWNAPGYWIVAASGLASTVTLPAAGGPYFAVVRGGDNLAGNWAAGGYDNYGSLGAYRIEVTGCAAPSQAPGAPRQVAAVQDGTNATISWRAPLSSGGSAITGYQVRIDDGDAVSVAGTTYVATGLSVGTHSVSVRALNGAGAGAGAPAVATFEVVAAPGAVSNLVVTPNVAKRSVLVRWGAPTSGGTPVEYRLALKRGGVTVQTVTFAAAPVSWTGTSLAAGSYTATVVAANRGGSSTVSRSTQLLAVPTVAATPTPSIKAGKKGGKKTVVLSWKVPAKSTSPRATAYKVVVYRVVKRKAKAFKTISVTSSALSREVTLPVKKGVTYAFTVQVRNSAGWSAVSKRSKAVAPK